MATSTLVKAILTKVFIVVLDLEADLCVMVISIDGISHTAIFPIHDLTLVENYISFSVLKGTIVNIDTNAIYRFGVGKDIDLSALPSVNINYINFQNPIAFVSNGSTLMINSQEVECTTAYATGGGINDEVSLTLGNYTIEFIID